VDPISPADVAVATRISGRPVPGQSQGLPRFPGRRPPARKRRRPLPAVAKRHRPLAAVKIETAQCGPDGADILSTASLSSSSGKSGVTTGTFLKGSTLCGATKMVLPLTWIVY